LPPPNSIFGHPETKGTDAMTDTAPTTVTSTTVACDGDHSVGGHPRVYVKLDPHTLKAVCPYCSQVFVLDANAKVQAH